jgi:hypothetical protein
VVICAMNPPTNARNTRRNAQTSQFIRSSSYLPD